MARESDRGRRSPPLKWHPHLALRGGTARGRGGMRGTEGIVREGKSNTSNFIGWF